MVTKIIVGVVAVFAAIFGCAPTTGDEPPSFGVLSCQCAIRTDMRVPPVRGSEVELGLLDGLAFAPARPSGRHLHPE